MCVGATVIIYQNNAIHNDEEDSNALSSILQYQNVCSFILIPVMFPIHVYAVSVFVLPLFFLVMVLLTPETPLLIVAQLFVSCAAVLYFIQSGNKKRLLVQMELERTKAALVITEEKLQRIESQTTDMHHMIGMTCHLYTCEHSFHSIRSDPSIYNMYALSCSNIYTHLCCLSIGSMAHDLKTPLQAFTFELENMSKECHQLVLNPNKFSDFKKNLDLNFSQLHTIVVFMSMAINRSLDYTKVSTGVALVPSLSSVDLAETTAWVMASLTHKVRNSVGIVMEPLSEEINATIMTDKQWLVENIFCYLSNAQKFTSEGQITVRVALPPPLLVQEREGEGQQMLVIEVEDSGIGLTDTQKQDLFQPFKQAQSRAGGTGLGLFSLLKRVASLGGECGVKDRPNHQTGSIFWFSFPYFPDTTLIVETNSHLSPASSSDTTCDTTTSDSSAHFRRILVVDDSILIQKATKRMLEREGYVVDVADNGYECLKLIHSQEYSYDLILLDLNMPIMDGLETVTRLRERELQSRFGYVDSDDNSGLSPSKGSAGCAASVVVGFSANTDAATKAEALEAGMDAFLCKPLSAQDLRVLNSYIAKEAV